MLNIHLVAILFLISVFEIRQHNGYFQIIMHDFYLRLRNVKQGL